MVVAMAEGVLGVGDSAAEGPGVGDSVMAVAAAATGWAAAEEKERAVAARGMGKGVVAVAGVAVGMAPTAATEAPAAATDTACP